MTSLCRWKASQQTGAEGALSDLTLKDKHGEVIEKQLPGGKVKKKAKNEIILETNTRSKEEMRHHHFRCTPEMRACTSRSQRLHIPNRGPYEACHGFGKHDLRCFNAARGAHLWSAAGLETFGIKLPEAAKLFGKKFASGASITKNPMEKDQIEVSCLGDVVGIE